jgi:hypothetical protein
MADFIGVRAGVLDDQTILDVDFRACEVSNHASCSCGMVSMLRVIQWYVMESQQAPGQ